jgi:hypothetical protein
MADPAETSRRKALKSAAQRLVLRGQLAEALLASTQDRRSTPELVAWCWGQIANLTKNENAPSDCPRIEATTKNIDDPV